MRHTLRSLWSLLLAAPALALIGKTEAAADLVVALFEEEERCEPSADSGN